MGTARIIINDSIRLSASLFGSSLHKKKLNMVSMEDASVIVVRYKVAFYHHPCHTKLCHKMLREYYKHYLPDGQMTMREQLYVGQYQSSQCCMPRTATAYTCCKNNSFYGMKQRNV